MKPITYPGNSTSLHVEYHRVKEFANYFLIYYKHSSVLRQDPKDAWRVLGVAKFTDNGKDLKQWCLDMHDQYREEEPNDNTKMVT